MATGPDIVHAITKAARTMHQQQTVEDARQAIAEVARASVPGFDHVGISTVDRRAKVRTGQRRATWSPGSTTCSTGSAKVPASSR